MRCIISLFSSKYVQATTYFVVCLLIWQGGRNIGIIIWQKVLNIWIACELYRFYHCWFISHGYFTHCTVHFYANLLFCILRIDEMPLQNWSGSEMGWGISRMALTIFFLLIFEVTLSVGNIRHIFMKPTVKVVLL